MPLPETKWRRLTDGPLPNDMLLFGDKGGFYLHGSEDGALAIQALDEHDTQLFIVSLDREEAGELYSWLGRLLDA